MWMLGYLQENLRTSLFIWQKSSGLWAVGVALASVLTSSGIASAGWLDSIELRVLTFLGLWFSVLVLFVTPARMWRGYGTELLTPAGDTSGTAGVPIAGNKIGVLIQRTAEEAANNVRRTGISRLSTRNRFAEALFLHPEYSNVGADLRRAFETYHFRLDEQIRAENDSGIARVSFTTDYFDKYFVRDATPFIKLVNPDLLELEPNPKS